MYGGVRMTRLAALGLVLELVLGAAAIWAGISFITNPDGSGLQMPVSWLRGLHSPTTSCPDWCLLRSTASFR